MSVYIEKLSHDGRGIARVSGKTTFIRGALAQEEVEFRLTRSKRDFDEGEVTTILQASADRVMPACAHYTRCGGCSLQHLHAPAQIVAKNEILMDQLARIGHVTPRHVRAPLTADVWHYRYKARLSVSFDKKTRSIRIGFRDQQQPDLIVDVQRCHVLIDAVNPLLDPLRALLKTLPNPGIIPQIEVAAGDDDLALIIRHLKPLPDVWIVQLKAFAQEAGVRIYLQAAGPKSVTLLFPENASPWLHYALPAFGINFKWHPTDFTQVNPRMNQYMVSHALELLDLQLSDVALDLFCGLGNFTLPMALFCQHVMGMEGSETMVERARMNAANHEIKNAEFFCASLDSAQSLASVASRHINKILMDPPRTGAYDLVKNMEIIAPERIVYVSCNPSTLARDVDVLVHQKGYTLDTVMAMDMFPHTTHVESMALLIRE